MFDLQLVASVKSIKVKVKKSKSNVYVRTCTAVFEREFDFEIAAALGGDAREALEALRSGGMKSCVLPMDRVNVQGTLRSSDGDDTVDLAELDGVKATGVADETEGDFPPSILLEFDFAFNEPAWVFLGKHCGSLAFLTCRRRQLDLAVDKAVKGLRKAGVTKVTARVGGETIGEVDLTDKAAKS
jgi:hypothetical protein